MTAGRRHLTLACGGYDRTRALTQGEVVPEGIDLTCLELSPEEVFFRMIRYREFDVAEMSLSSYVLSLNSESPPFIAIPVFPSRAFRHGCIFVNRDAGVEGPGDLVGKRVGVPEYQMTAPVWIRGILAEHHQVPVESVSYVCGGLEQPGRTEKIVLDLPDSVRISAAPAGETLSRMLAAGTIDALHTARVPSSFDEDRVVRLFPDFPEVEKSYFVQTKIFPIMHTVVLRREIFEQSPWIARSLYKAFEAALRASRPALHDSSALRYSLPWLIDHAEQTEKALGPEPWAYGLTATNRDVLATFLGYSRSQGLSRRDLTPDQLFAPETLESFAV